MRTTSPYWDAAETLPPDQLNALQQRRWRAMLAYAARELPFYQERFRDAGIVPQDIKTYDDFSRLPRLKKADLVAAFKERGHYRIGLEGLRGAPIANVVMTSGTLNFNTFASFTAHELRQGIVRCVTRELWMQGVRPGMQVLVLLPGWHLISLLESRALARLGARCVMPVGTHLPSHAMRFVETAQAAQPDYILAFTPLVPAMLDACKALGKRPREVFGSVRYLSVVGEALTPGMRAWLRSELDVVDVYERGGSSDGLWGGGECAAHRGHHVYADYYLIEVVDPETGLPVPPGEMGSVVVTTLTPGKSIYVRFDCEDWGVLLPGPCPCGRTHPVLELYDRLAHTQTIAGRKVTVQHVHALLDEIPDLLGRPFLVERTPRDGTRLLLHLTRVPGVEMSELAAQVTRQVQCQLGLEADLRWHDRVPQSGKGRLVDTGTIQEALWPNG